MIPATAPMYEPHILCPQCGDVCMRLNRPMLPDYRTRVACQHCAQGYEYLPPRVPVTAFTWNGQQAAPQAAEETT